MDTTVLISWLTFATTLILAGITGYYAVQTKRLVDETRGMVQESVRGVIQVSMVRRGQLVIARVRNSGQRAATAIRFEYRPEAPPKEQERLGGGRRLEQFFSRGLSMLAAGESVYHDATVTSVIRDWETNHPGEPLLVEVRAWYFDGFRERTERTALDLRDILAHEILAPGPTPEMDTGVRIARALEELTQPIPHPAGVVGVLRRIAEALDKRTEY